VNARIRRVSPGAAYTLLDATFETAEQVNGTGNSRNSEAQGGIPGVDGTIRIVPGNRIPLIPRHLLKAYADVDVTSKLVVNLGLFAAARSYARGNENNLHQPDGMYYLGPGTSPGYAVVNGRARYQITPHVELFVRADNLLNRRYYTAAQLGHTGFTADGRFAARPLPAVDGDFPVPQSTFFAPGAPRGVWGGMRLRF
jgi:outer membrane receptor protein involved in Fe transport